MKNLNSDLLERTYQAELMDDPALASDEHDKALSGLARLNAVSGSANLIWRPIRRLSDELARPLKVLELACGRGDVSLALGQMARSSGRHVEIDGCDISPRAIYLAKQRAEAQAANSQYFILDVLNEPLPVDYDVIMTSLFLHHLEDKNAIELMRNMALAAKELVIINDLTRSKLSLSVVNLACRLLSRSPIVHFDGPASVRNSFTPSELLKMAEEAGLKDGKIKEQLPCLMLFSWRQEHSARQP